MEHADDTPPALPPASGGTVLSLLADPFCAQVLSAHLGTPLSLPDLAERIGGAKRTTLRRQVDHLRSIAALERHVRPVMPYTVENELTDLGNDILGVAEHLEDWLARAPQGTMTIGSAAATGAIRALVNGWESTVLHALASGPLSLAELNASIPGMSYPSIERRLSAMRSANQVVAVPTPGGAKPHVVTDWGREGVGPLLAAGRCAGCRHAAHPAARPTGTDIETSLLLVTPLVSLSGERSGPCLLAVEADDGEGLRPGASVTGVHLEVEGGRVSSCTAELQPKPETWVLGSVESWVRVLVDGQGDGLRAGGSDPELARTIVSGLRTALEVPRTM